MSAWEETSPPQCVDEHVYIQVVSYLWLLLPAFQSHLYVSFQLMLTADGWEVYQMVSKVTAAGSRAGRGAVGANGGVLCLWGPGGLAG